MWGRSWVFVLARTRTILELTMTVRMAIENMAVETMAVETVGIKQAPLINGKQG